MLLDVCMFTILSLFDTSWLCVEITRGCMWDSRGRVFSWTVSDNLGGCVRWVCRT